MKFKPWQLWGLVPTILGGMFFHSSINPPKQAEAVTAAEPSRIPLTPQELIEQRLKQGPAPQAGLPKAAPGVTLTTLYRFKGSDGRYPNAGVKYIDNVFYGTTSRGGANDVGTIFKLTPAGHVLTTLHSFNNTDGAVPATRLVGDKEGNFYGPTIGGGAYNRGTIFKLSPSGILTTLYSFNGKGEGSSPEGKLFRNGSGYLFGTTNSGGANGYGTIFRLSPGGNLKVLHTFNSSDGEYPSAGLIQGSVGNFYGTTSGGGANRYGTVFKLTRDGTLTTLHSFNGSDDGAGLLAELIQDSVGNLFGTTNSGLGANRYGTVFKLTRDGTLTTLHSFNDSDGASPSAELIQDSVGNLFGTTDGGGKNKSGTVFQITPDGVFTSLYSFGGGKDGRLPTNIRLFKGALYGTTNVGGTLSGTCRLSFGCGTIFKLSISPSAPVRKRSPQPILQSPPDNPNE